MVPPLIYVASMVKLSPFVIETMYNLMAYNHSYATIVQAFREMLMVKGGLQNARRKHWNINQNENNIAYDIAARCPITIIPYHKKIAESK